MEKGDYLSACDGELLLALLALSGLVIFQPGVALMGAMNINTWLLRISFQILQHQLYKPTILNFFSLPSELC